MRIIVPIPVGVISPRVSGQGYPQAHNSSRTAGNGISTFSVAYYYLIQIQNNVANSVHIFDWTIENVPSLQLPWRLPLLVTWFNSLIRLDSNQSVVCPAMIGGLFGFNAGLPHTQWRTDVSRKRAGIIVERDGVGTVTWFLSWSNGVVQGSQSMLALPSNSWVALLYTPNPKRLEVFVNGQLWSGTASGDLPSGNPTDGIMYSIGVAKKLGDGAIDASLRQYFPNLLVG